MNIAGLVPEKDDSSSRVQNLTAPDEVSGSGESHSKDSASTFSRSSILYTNADSTLFVIDIPTSISLAQSLPDQPPPHRQFLSCPPPATPYPSTEPSSEKARKRVLDRLGHDEGYVRLNAEYATLIENALDFLKSEDAKRPNEPRVYCLPRAIHANTNNSTRKRQANELSTLDLSSSQRTLELLKNHTTSPTTLQHLSTPLTLPPLTTTLLGPIHPTPSTLTTFHTTCLSHPTTQPQPGRFPLLILDPPWPNKSVSRSSSYTTSPTLPFLIDTLQFLGLDQHMTEDGYVAVWITNNPSCRAAVLGEGGLFEQWGVSVVEEWVWCKITTQGMPVTEVRGLWRKPWEVCLIGQRRVGGEEGEELEGRKVEVKRRVVLGVPDLHSRKPCLKELVERMLFSKGMVEGIAEGKGVVALELYARYAVAGWMSWGLEAVKYNGEEWWVERDAEQDGELKKVE